MAIVEDPKKVALWKQYLTEHTFEVVMPSLILKELVCNINVQENPKALLKFMKIGSTMNPELIETKHDAGYYLVMADQFIKKHKIKEILEAKGLCETDKTGRKWYALHREDLAILISLKELGGPYYFITKDGKLKKALSVKEIKDILLSEGIKFILLYEEENKPLIRIKILPEY